MHRTPILILVPVALALSGCLGSGSSGAGGGAAVGGGAGAGAGAGVPTTPALSAAGTGTVAVRGLSSRFEKNVQIAGAGPVPTQYELGRGTALGFGTANSWANFDAAQAAAPVTGSADFTDINTGTATLNVLTNGTYTGGAAITDFASTSATVGGAGRGQGTDQQFNETGANPLTDPISSAVVASDDTDTDGNIDLVLIDLVVNQTNTLQQFEEVGIYYGGTFADQAALNTVAAATVNNIPVYTRNNSGTPDDAVLFSVSTLDGLAANQADIYSGNIFVGLDLNTNLATAEISNVQQADAGVGGAVKPFYIEIFNAPISGTAITGGTIEVRDTGTNAVLDTITAGGMDAAVMGANAEYLTGVFQGVGTTSGDANSIGTDLGVAAGTDIFLNGRFTADD